MERTDALNALQSESSDEQVRALAALGKCGKTEDIHYIIPLIQHGSFEIRHIASGIASSILRTNLLECYDQQTEESLITFSKLLTKLIPDLIQELTRDLCREQGKRQINALKLFRHLECTPNVKSMLTTLLVNGESEIRTIALGILQTKAEGIDHSIITKWIHSSDERLRANAIEVIEHLKDTSLLYLLFELKNDPNNRIRANVLKALHAMINEDIIRDLVSMLDSGNVKMISSALWVVSQMENVTSYALFKRASKMLRHPDVGVVDNAVKALRNCNVHEARSVLLNAGFPMNY